MSVSVGKPMVPVRARRVQDEVVDVELLVVPDCPNESVALSVLRLAFDRVGLAAQSVGTTVIASQEQAQERGFVGSPTILINGADRSALPGRARRMPAASMPPRPDYRVYRPWATSSPP